MGKVIDVGETIMDHTVQDLLDARSKAVFTSSKVAFPAVF
jgi:hypothetical protein